MKTDTQVWVFEEYVMLRLLLTPKATVNRKKQNVIQARRFFRLGTEVNKKRYGFK